MILDPLAHPLLVDALRWLEAWTPSGSRERQALAEFRGALAQDPPAVWRHPHRTHLTSSTFAFSPDLRRLLMVHHAKGGFWVQAGGHPEDGDTSVVRAALRELAEETGAAPIVGTTPLVLDLDHHALSGAFGHCASHLDFGVVVLVDPNAPLSLSEESKAVGWFDVDDLPEELPQDFDARLGRVLAAARRSLAG